jgi:hypothetical protein
VFVSDCHAEPSSDVFISYARVDWRHAADIDCYLQARGFTSFFDRRNLPPGLPWVRELEKALNATKAAIILIGPHGLGNTQQYERDLALYRQTREPSFPIVPVILPRAEVDRPFNFLQILTWIDFTRVADRLGSIIPQIKDADVWRTGADLISANCGIVTSPLENRTGRVLPSRPSP